MFEVGATYEFRMLQEGGELTFRGTVAAYEHPLLKLEETPPLTIQLVGFGSEDHQDEPYEIGTTPSRPGKIINVVSPSFVSAQQIVE